ncbi:cGMP-dependent 3',5'-cyclic phosphodiesterase-like [Saccoglossus kowalevskii]
MATTTPSRDRRKFVKRLSSDGRKSVDDKTAEMSDRRRQETFEDALLELCAVLDWESLNEVIQNVLKDCLPNVTDSVVYILDNLSSNLQCKDQVTNTVHDLPKAGLARSVADGKKRISCNGLTQQDSLSGLLPSGVQPLSSNKTVLCTPIVDSQTDNVVCVLGVVCDVITLVDEKKLNLLEKHILVCIQRLLRTTYQYSRSSSVLSWSQSQSILKLCEDLYDRDAASLQLKVINYLEEQTDSEFCVILLRAEEEYEMCCQVLRNEVLEHEIVILTHGNLSDVIASKKAATLNELGDSAVELSQKLGMTINSMLCVPLTKRKSTEIAAIVCAFNKKGGQSYTEEDEARIRFCFKYTSSIIASALAFQKENKLKKETEALLQMAKNLFTHLDDVCVLLKEVMQEARNMTHAERCSLFLVENNELVAKVFDGNVTENGEVLGEVRIPINQGIAGHVATSGRILNIKDAYSHPLFYRGVDETTGFRTRNILCFPINDESGKVIGIAELCNKINAPYFGKHDEEVALAFSVYCGISIVHSLMYKKVKDAQYRSKLSNELMMYHMQISCDELQQLIAADIPKPETFLADIAQYSSIPRAVPESETPLIEILGLFVASLCHDLDHRGTNNSFQVQSESVLASLYSSEGSVLERHHFSQALCILNTEGCNIFENITSKDYQEVLDLMQEIILATDLAHHLRIIKDLKKMAVEGYKKEDPHCHKLLRCLFMTACDLSDQTKNWQTIKKVAVIVYSFQNTSSEETWRNVQRCFFELHIIVL